MKTLLLFSFIVCLGMFSAVLGVDAIPWTSEENMALDADAIAVGRIVSYQDDGSHRYYEISIIKWIKNSQPDQTITMGSITLKAFIPHFPYAIFQKKDLGLFYLKSVDGKWQSTNYSHQIMASELNDTIHDMKKLVGNNNHDSSVSLERVCKKEGYVDTVKNRTGEIICVKPQTLQKLIQRGWAVSKEGHAFTDSIKQEILTKLRKGPQSVNDTAKEFLISAALADDRVWDLLKDADYQVNCCSYTLDGNKFPYPLYIGITFQINEKDMLVTATYDLQQEKVTNVETEKGIRTGGVVSFEQKQEPFLTDKNGKVDLSKINLPPTKYGQIDFGKIGYLVSENEFKKILGGKNITYDSDDLVFIEGLSQLSYPPTTDYCGYVVSNDNQDYWFWSSYHNDTLLSAKFYNENPDPCKPSYVSCPCSLQRQLAEQNVKELSYLDDSEEESIGKTLKRYLSETPVANVSDKFIVGKFNFGLSLDTTPYCGKFVDENQNVYFEGHIQRSKVVGFELAFEKPKLCAISDDAKIFDFVKAPIPE